MRFNSTLPILVILALALPTFGVKVKQENTFFVENVDWEHDTLTNTVKINIASASQIYVFWAHADGDPNTLAPIEEIKRDPLLVSGTIRLNHFILNRALTGLWSDPDDFTVPG